MSILEQGCGSFAFIGLRASVIRASPLSGMVFVGLC